MVSLVLGNLVALVGALFMMYSGLIKDKQKFILIQSIQIALFIASNLVLGGIMGAISNTISFIRNIFCYKGKFTKEVKVLFIIIPTILMLLNNTESIMGILPVCSFMIYTSFMDIKDIVKFKRVVIVTLVLWFGYDIFIKSYILALFDFITIITNLVAIRKIKLTIA